MSAAQPLPTKSSKRAGRNRRGAIKSPFEASTRRDFLDSGGFRLQTEVPVTEEDRYRTTDSGTGWFAYRWGVLGPNDSRVVSVKYARELNRRGAAGDRRLEIPNRATPNARRT